MKVEQERRGQFLLSTDKELLQIKSIHHFLAKESYWCQEIPETIVQTAIENSLCFGIYDESHSERLQVGYARVVSDYATFAWVCDVYIEKEYRKKGLSLWMMQFLLKHPQLQQLRRICLGTLYSHKLYEKVGFSVTKTPTSWMEIKDNEIYRKMKRDE